jgi:hypothetical protein
VSRSGFEHLRGAVLAALLTLAGCAAPDETADTVARNAGMIATEIATGGFTLRLYRREGGVEPAVLDVYLDGDGTPWIDSERIAADPTPHRALALELMALDPGPSLYLGRPCYFGHAGDAGCEPALWTSARYGPVVVGTLADALRQLAPGRKLRLIGFSGGGVLATLLATRLPQTVGVITIAADLDLASWTSARGFSPLTGSLDPADEPVLPDSIMQRHLLAGRDEVVPAGSADRYLSRVPPGSVITWPDFTHACCWKAMWPRFIATLRSGSGPADIPLAYKQ